VQQHFILHINGVEEGRAAISTLSKIIFGVSWDVWTKKNDILVIFRLPEALSPSSLGVALANCAIALGVQSITITCAAGKVICCSAGLLLLVEY